MNLIKQPNNFTCGAACVCMLTGKTLEEFYAFCGHDGSELGKRTKLRPLGRRGFSNKELYLFLIENGLSLGFGFKHVEESEVEQTEFNIDLIKVKALVDVEVTNGLLHCVLWDGKRIIDPLCPEETRTVKDYAVFYGWWPVFEFTDDVFEPLS